MADEFRVLPKVTDSNRHFWQGGEDGRLHILRCQDCGYWIHPAYPRCPACLSKDVEPEATSGLGTVHTFTLNHHPWNPTHEHPYVIAVVALDEQEGLRVTSNVIGCDPQDVHIGQRVQVTFRQFEDVHLPQFEPTEDGGDA